MGAGAGNGSDIASRSWHVPGFSARLERAKRRGGPAPERPDEGAVVVVGDLPRAVIELELFEVGEDAIALLG